LCSLRPAALIAVFAGGKIVKAGDGVLALTGEGWVGGAGLSVRLVEGSVGSVVIRRNTWCGLMLR